MLIPAALLVLGTSMSAHAALDLKPRHPDEPAEYTFNERFSAKSALDRARQVRSILESFRKLTEMSRDKFSAKQLKDVGNTERDMQELGFSNIPSILEGTILKQDYQIKKLEYDLAVQQSKAGKLSSEKLETARKDFEQSEQAFQKFWNSFGVSD